MDDCEKFFYLIGRIDNGKHELLDFLEFFDYHETHEDMYELIIRWSEDKVMEFVNWFDWIDFDELEESIYEFDSEHIT